MSYQAVDQKKEDFRKYLEKNGVVDALTKALVGLYEEPEKPENPLDFLNQVLNSSGAIDIEALKAENDSLKKKVSVLEAKLAEMAADAADAAAQQQQQLQQ